MATGTQKVWKWVGIGCLSVVLFVFAACCGLVVAIRNAPLSCPDRDLIHKGMTKDEVRAKLGEPKMVDESEDGDRWYYDCGPFSLSSPISVYFDKDGRVEYAYILD
jgi:hypothetical protein